MCLAAAVTRQGDTWHGHTAANQRVRIEASWRHRLRGLRNRLQGTRFSSAHLRRISAIFNQVDDVASDCSRWTLPAIKKW